jgi:hypothetical protein
VERKRTANLKMKSILCLFTIPVVAALLASCAQPEKTSAPAKASRMGSHFISVGKVTMHSGQPCASQIMFDFRTTGVSSTVALAAPIRETKLLTEAANRNLRVQVWGTWQRDRHQTCNYVNVTKVQPASIAIVF